MQKKILAVDDDVDILEMLKILLNMFGYDVQATLRGQEVFDRITQVRPDLILMDVTLSGIDGRDISRKLKENKDTSNIPIILISALPGSKIEMMDCGADDFLNKPFDITSLQNKIKQHLETSSSNNVASYG